MASLVGYGVSSDSESEGDLDDVNTASRVVDAGAPGVNKSRNFLVESGSSASSELDSGSEEDQPQPPAEPCPPAVRPPASLSSSSSSSPPSSSSFLSPFLTTSRRPSTKLPPPPLDSSCSGSSVFSNPFKAQADQKLHALQKHVPLTVHANPSQIGGKRVCVAYRKDGRCRFGIKCKFAHDSDLQTPPGGDSRPLVGTETPESNHRSACHGDRARSLDQEEAEGQQVRKRRVGLSNTLIPPKRALKQYATQRGRERLNMS